ncbi:hypothetical protein [Amnibacterium endophyticum]|uniref:Response regulator n=1 Tax=Amnibacterium endophyticum TaxID=2109337 RepID=A0ABW4LEM6_9MICO
MATRSIKVEFVRDEVVGEVTGAPEVHDISVPEDVTGAPTVLENPHVDYPGEWTLVGEGEGGVYRYAKDSEVASTNDTAAG